MAAWAPGVLVRAGRAARPSARDARRGRANLARGRSAGCDTQDSPNTSWMRPRTRAYMTRRARRSSQYNARARRSDTAWGHDRARPEVRCADRTRALSSYFPRGLASPRRYSRRRCPFTSTGGRAVLPGLFYRRRRLHRPNSGLASRRRGSPSVLRPPPTRRREPQHRQIQGAVSDRAGSRAACHPGRRRTTNPRYASLATASSHPMARASNSTGPVPSQCRVRSG